MRLKLYRAASTSEAMARVRAELGPEAIILGTRRAGDGVELTAALEEEPEIGPAPLDIAHPEHDPGRAAALAWHAVPESMAEGLGRGSLEDALAGAFAFAALPLAAREAPLLLVGPPGAGKTLTAARLATRLVLGGAPPLVITADGKRAGAPEQLAAFTRLLGLSLIVADTPVMLARALTHRKGGAPVLIDAPGTDPFDPTQRAEMAALAGSAGARIALVLPAGLHPEEAAELAAAYAGIGADLLIATRLDLTRRLGAVMAAARAGGLTLTEAGIGPGAADGLVPLTPAFLAARLGQAHPVIAHSVGRAA